MNDSFDGARRRFMQLGLSGLACAAISTAATPALAMMPRVKGVKTLAFYNLHTDEKLRVTYWKDGIYSRPALARINNILRDYRTGDVCTMHIGLMDLLHDLQARLKNHGTIEIISGYRSPRTNAMLASETDGVARHSYHTKGMAMDIRVPGTSLSHLHNVALHMVRGGVGYYPTSEFVHVDVGPVRRW